MGKKAAALAMTSVGWRFGRTVREAGPYGANGDLAGGH